MYSLPLTGFCDGDNYNIAEFKQYCVLEKLFSGQNTLIEWQLYML